MSSWKPVCPLDDIPPLGSRIVADPAGNIALFRDAGAQVFALRDRCPHKGGPLSQGIVHGAGENTRVTCPLHGWHIALQDGEACAPDVGCAKKFAARVDDGMVWLEI